jgi:hypothetical protein
MDMVDRHTVAAGGVVDIEELGIPGDAVVELGSAGHVGVVEDVLPHYAVVRGSADVLSLPHKPPARSIFINLRARRM